ncbi:SWI/SNF-related matrix-associated actin-dependent regulator 1 of chromatin subfamily A [Breznakibacter xylanolyticus]|uniref:SWI/SNF-related matrix-associated actin-dependent regulator 1 of chromatin subfamily A n=1 Tax=Breznakibacter xylanolyticus TaxID=990 RepID=A0A2W7NCH6_9BACT|nr:DEAD/DEAH box helicase [Breznakibacter xylanolyticus]PZX18081.1 SWI/SNF-related matrix-associated actin-dependent regulator 1 of chromatin subfamily A [Breznakibacter xylanolyticus]
MHAIEQNGLIELSFQDKASIVNDIKTIPGRRWNPTKKLWTVPVSERAKVDRLMAKYGTPKAAQKPELVGDIPPMPELTIDIPLNMTPFPYQKTGIACSLNFKRLIVGDQPGLGKTGQAIATITGANAFPCLVICPSSLKINWQREWTMWAGKKAMILNDRNRDTWHLFANPKNNLFGVSAMVDVFITNYESLKKYFVASIINNGGPLRLDQIRFKENINIIKSVIIDESHRVKDASTQQSKIVKGVASGKEYILALTGTPVVNKPRDLVSQLGIIDQLKVFGGHKHFVDRYCQEGGTNLKELNFLLRKNCFYRREKTEVLKDLPAKMRQIAYCDITTRKEYRDALADLEKYLKLYRQATDEQVARSMKGEVMVRIGVLKNISARGKINDVVDYVKDVIESGEKIVVFVHLKEVAQMLLKFFPSAVTILGDDDMQTRQRNIDSFQKDPDTQIIICSIKAAGVGITLTASSRVAFVEQPWHPADSEQCEDRCHRIGQKDSVQCIYFLGKDTIDEWIYKVIEEKRSIANTIVGAVDEVETSIMESVMSLFNPK